MLKLTTPCFVEGGWIPDLNAGYRVCTEIPQTCDLWRARVEIGQTLRESCEQKGIEIGFDLRPSGALLNGLNDDAALCAGHDDLSSAKAIDLRGAGFDEGKSIPVSEYREAVIIAVHALVVRGATTPSTKSRSRM